MRQRFLLGLLLFVATAIPFQIAFAILPIPTFLNELMAFLGWGILLIAVGLRGHWSTLSTGLKLALAAVAVLALAVALQVATAFVSNPKAGLSWGYFLACGGLCCLAGYQVAKSDMREHSMDLLALSWTIGCGLSIATELVQFLQLPVHPYLVAPLRDAGRLYGNIRQPNHLATFLATGLVAVAWLFYRKRMNLFWAVVAFATISAGVALTSSRTGLVSMGVLFLCGVLLTRRMPSVRVVIWIFPLWIFSVVWVAVALAEADVLPYFGVTRTGGTFANLAENSGARFELWANTLSIIRENWVLGTGFGQFQFFYLLSDIPIEFSTAFNNAHNLPLHLASEFGVPITLLVVFLLITSLYLSRSALRDSLGRTGLLFLVPVTVHSLFEFPLWYAYFLLPAAAIFGGIVGRGGEAVHVESVHEFPKSDEPPRGKVLVFGGLAMIGCLLVAVTHYLALGAIYKPGGAGDTLEERLDTAKRAFIYGHWINNSIATSLLLENPSEDQVRRLLPLFESAARFNMDELFLYRYTLVLMHNGQYERAERTAYALGLRQSPFVFKLKAYCDARPEPAFKALSAFLTAPTAMKASAKDFPR
jgi:Virulence factor membrane-bound polymerase, C-terminal/O-Antigen ligase/Protein glycosylation ligase